MEWNKFVTLTGESESGQDADGFPIPPAPKLTENVLASFKSVRGNEFYTANAQGIMADIIVVINAVNYAGERKLMDEETGKKYEVIRTYEVGQNIELTVTDLGVERNGN